MIRNQQMMQSKSTNRSDLLVKGLGLLAVAVMTVGIFMAFVYAPTDADQGDAQRIFYVHVPMAWLARSSAELGFLFTTLVLITGSLWGRPIWNAWWQWEARLTTTLILWFIFI